MSDGAPAPASGYAPLWGARARDSPWGSDQRYYTRLDVWLMRQVIRVSHSQMAAEMT